MVQNQYHFKSMKNSHELKNNSIIKPEHQDQIFKLLEHGKIVTCRNTFEVYTDGEIITIDRKYLISQLSSINDSFAQ